MVIIHFTSNSRHNKLDWDDPFTYILGSVVWLFPLQVALMIRQKREMRSS